MSYELSQCIAPLPPVERGKSVIIGGDPKGKNFLYCSGNSVVIRDIENPAIADIYTEHSQKTTVAKYAPSGFYIASADKSGKVRIWDTVNKEHILKYEYHPFAGEIRDLAWDGESKRIVVCGEGRQNFAAAFLWDSGSKCGNFTGLSKVVTSCDIKASRPFRAICGSDDSTTVFYHGVPFKFEKTLKEHTRFVNCVRYNTSGSHFATVSSDGHVFLYDGKTGDLVRELGSPAHKGGIYACSWNKEGTKLLTASGDKTAKIFDVESGSVVNDFQMGTEVGHQQLGCLWQNDHLLSIGLNGFINYLDPNTNSTIRSVHGHTKNINCMTVHKASNSVVTGDYDGNVCSWDAVTGEGNMYSGKGHGAQITALANDNLDGMVSVGFDNKLRISSLTEKNLDAHEVDLKDQPIGLGLQGQSIPIVITPTSVITVNGSKINAEALGFEPSAMDAKNDLICIGAKDQKGCFIYSKSGASVTKQQELDINDPITAIKFSADGEKLAVADKTNCIHTFETKNFTLIEKCYGHRARVSQLAWSSNGWLASGNIDQKVLVHNFQERKVEIAHAHRMSSVVGLDWLKEDLLVSAGGDGSLKQWKISFD